MCTRPLPGRLRARPGSGRRCSAPARGRCFAWTFDDACGWLTQACGRRLTAAAKLERAQQLRKKIRWRHELEDVLSPEIGHSTGSRLADVVLVAADNFGAMLSAYQRDAEPPSAESLRAMMRTLMNAPVASAPTAPAAGGIAAQFRWTEYEHLMISEAVHRGETVYNVALRVDPASSMHAAALQLIRNVFHACGTVIALRPEDNSSAETLEIVEAALASHQSEERIAQLRAEKVI